MCSPHQPVPGAVCHVEVQKAHAVPCDTDEINYQSLCIGTMTLTSIKHKYCEPNHLCSRSLTHQTPLQRGEASIILSSGAHQPPSSVAGVISTGDSSQPCITPLHSYACHSIIMIEVHAPLESSPFLCWRSIRWKWYMTRWPCLRLACNHTPRSITWITRPHLIPYLSGY